MVASNHDDPRKTGKQIRPGLWETINDRYPGSMIECDRDIPLAPLGKPLEECRLSLISSCGVHEKGERPLDTCHPFGDFGFKRIRSELKHNDLEIHQLKYPHDDADVDVNVIFPIERLQELVTEGTLGSLTRHFFAFIGYNMDPPRFIRTVVRDIAQAVVEEEGADIVLLAPA